MYDWTTTTRNAQFSRHPGRVFRAGSGNASPLAGTAVLHADFPADEAGPVIVSPADNATGVSLTAPLVLTFDEDLAFGTSGTITLRKNTAGTWSDVEAFDVATEIGGGAGQVSIGGAGNTVLTLRPTAALAASTEHALRFTAGAIKDGRGNAMAAIADDTTRSFTTAAAPSLTLLGTLTGFGVGAGSITVDLTSLGLAQNDLVRIAVFTASNANRTIAMTSTGYTQVNAAKVDTVGTHRVSGNLFEKVMGASPDASAVIAAPGSSNTAHVVLIKAWRGARLSPTLDVAVVNDSGTGGLVIDPPANTPVTNNTRIEYWGVGARASGTSDLYSSGDIADLASGAQSSAGYTAVWFHGSRTWTTGSGAIDPAALTIAGSVSANSWICLTSTVSPA